MTVRGTNREPALAALLIAEDRELASQLNQALTEARLFEVQSEIKSYPQEHTLEIRLRQIQPEVVLLDLGSDFAVAERLIRFIGSFQPSIQVIGLHSSPNAEVLVPSLRAGASEFLSAPFDASAQRDAAARIRRLREPGGGNSQDYGKVIAFTSAKPGSGASTLATQTAFCLKRMTGKRVLLADFDILSGSIAFALKLNPTYTLVDALERSDQLDPGLWSSLTINASGVDVLAAPDSAISDSIESSRLHDVLEYARMLYDWVVVDLPTVFHRLSLFVLSEAEQSFLISTSELPSLHLARRAVNMLAQLGYGKERFQMVINRLNKKAEISRADIEKVLNCPVFATIPNDYYALHKVVTRAEPLPPDCDLGRAIESVTTRVAGLAVREGQPAAAALESKPVLSEG
ncbi:MAG: AAA family ATPase [Candidatus Solibacter usitatus]|nr:AAA family ATPase [Candidatus Solibacter usitatus]